ncbi:MAG: DNA repair and recombination protein RadB [Candidatus Nanohaloarchaea archaeon]|nr:DNA repair and recombination protein RadB [Candidatus Nanohaloarchaea archaeon]
MEGEIEIPARLEMGCSSLDELLNGGIEEGAITNVYGKSGTGKTNFCVQATARCLQKGGKAVFVDTEGGFSPERFLQIIDDKSLLDNLLMIEPTTFEEQKDAFKELEDVVEREDPDLVVVDSLVALYRLKLQNDDAPEINQEFSKQLSILSKIARQNDLPVLVTNQVYSQFDSDEVELVGRDIPTYWSKCLLKLEKVGKNYRKAVLKKHRSRPEGLEATFSITSSGLESREENEVELF